MSLFYEDAWLTVHNGDCREVLRELPDESVNCVVTSPPYWGLRDYGTATWEGGDPECAHSVGGQVQDSKWAGAITTGQRPGVDASRCRKCGARRIDAQLGLEPTPEEYVAHLVDVFREVRRVMRADATLWLNLGDSYAGSWGSQGRQGNGGEMAGRAVVAARGLARTQIRASAKLQTHTGSADRTPGVKPKDLVGIPWMVAFALRADGWYLRSDIIWAKGRSYDDEHGPGSVMPESVRDRPAKSHEYVFLLTKSARYYYDSVGVREASAQDEHNQRYAKVYDAHTANVAAGRAQPGNVNNIGLHSRPGSGGRNLRSVWYINPKPYGGEHFAAFPSKLAEPCIKAGCPERVCPECGAPWERQTTTSGGRDWRSDRMVAVGIPGERSGVASLKRGRSASPLNDVKVHTTTGWAPGCAHDDEPIPGVVLDPFGGSGTTALTAERLGRKSVLIELNPGYAEQSLRRVAEGRAEGTGAPVDLPLPVEDDSLWAGVA